MLFPCVWLCFLLHSDTDEPKQGLGTLSPNNEYLSSFFYHVNNQFFKLPRID